MNRKLITTNDGSQTIFVEDLNETYHSIHGAIQEANHVFIDHGLRLFHSDERVRILEVGFGTGLNALLTFLNADNLKLNVDYVGVEAFPVEEELLEKIEYPSFLEGGAEEMFKRIHDCAWNEKHELSNSFALTKMKMKIELLQSETNFFDLIYFDAFGPAVQGELWQPTILNQMYDLLKLNGVLVTYCAKGQVKRDLKSAGFTVETLPGPPGKREMTRAIKS